MAQKYHILKEYANGVMDEKGKFFPYKFISSTGSTDITGRKDCRYYIKSIYISAQSAGILGTGTIAVRGYVNKAQWYLARVDIAAQTQAVDFQSVTEYFNCSVLLDLGSDIDSYANVSSGYVGIVYAVVDEIEGEYSG